MFWGLGKDASFSWWIGLLVLVLALPVACNPVTVDPDNRPCSSGGCIGGYECHPVDDICVPEIQRGCVPGSICWWRVEAGDPCTQERSFLPCGPSGDCISGCRTCVDKLWDECTVLSCDLGDLTDCSRCGDDCGATVQNAYPICELGEGAPQCGYTGCFESFIDVDGDGHNGCECERDPVGEVCDGIDNDCDGLVDEIEIGTGAPENLACGPGETCIAGECTCGLLAMIGAPACAASEACCNDQCRDTTSNALSCGSCGRDCTTLPSVDNMLSVGCSNGRCLYSCVADRGDCDGVDDGCETDLRYTTDHCGSCVSNCNALPGIMTAACVDSACQVSCAIDRADCDGDLTNGCEPATAGRRGVCPGTSCQQILVDGYAQGTGIYWIDPDSTGPFQVVCDMDMDNDGGGWTLLMKATQGATFTYAASYWITNNVLNELDLSTADSDAKYDSFNRLPVTDLRAVWRDFLETDGVTPWVWLEEGAWQPAVVALTGFSTFKSLGSPQASPTFDGRFFSSQAALSCIPGQETGRYGIDLNPTSLCSSCGNAASCSSPDYVRWGYRFNENGCCNWASDDAGGGIGLSSRFAHYYSAGDWWTGAGGAVAGANRMARVEIWGR